LDWRGQASPISPAIFSGGQSYFAEVQHNLRIRSSAGKYGEFP